MLFPTLLLLFAQGASHQDVTLHLRDGRSLKGRILSVTDRIALAVDGQGDTSQVPLADLAGIIRNDSLDTGPFDLARIRRYAEAALPVAAADTARPASAAPHPTPWARDMPTWPGRAVQNPSPAPQAAGSPDPERFAGPPLRDPVCRYARRQTHGLVADICRDLVADPGLSQAWVGAYEASNMKTTLAAVTGAGAVLLWFMAANNAAANTLDCADKVFGLEGRDCGGKPVAGLALTGSMLGIGSIVSMVFPNTERERAMAMTRRRDRSL